MTIARISTVNFRITIIKSVSCSMGKNLVYSIQLNVGCQEKTLLSDTVMTLFFSGIYPFGMAAVTEKKVLKIFHKLAESYSGGYPSYFFIE
jgi:hypothetical protein